MKTNKMILSVVILNIGFAISGVSFAGCNSDNCPGGDGGNDCIFGLCANTSTQAVTPNTADSKKP